jgi:tripeptidyl-peptidase I
MKANLDIQYAESISFPTPNIYYSTGGSPPFIPDSITPSNTNEPYLDWLNFVLEQETIPQTISTSYGDDEQTVPPDYAASVCDLFVQLGSRGVSVLFSSGDFGVGGGSCVANDGSNHVKFIPVFPASCG